MIHVLVQSILYTCVVYFMCGFLTNAGGSPVLTGAVRCLMVLQPRSCLLTAKQARESCSQAAIGKYRPVQECSCLTAPRCACREVFLVRARLERQTDTSLRTCCCLHVHMQRCGSDTTACPSCRFLLFMVLTLCYFTFCELRCWRMPCS